MGAPSRLHRLILLLVFFSGGTAFAGSQEPSHFPAPYLDNWSGVPQHYDGAKRVFEGDPEELLEIEVTFNGKPQTKAQIIPKDQSKRYLGKTDEGTAFPRGPPSALDTAEAASKEAIPDIEAFMAKTITQKYDDIARAWKVTYYKDLFYERTMFENIMAKYRYLPPTWGHTADISKTFEAIDFYDGFKLVGQDTIQATTAVSMKTTTVASVDAWLKSEPIKANINKLLTGFESGIKSNGKTITYSKAEIHIYMPKANYDDAQLVKTWMDRLKLDYANFPELEFKIYKLEDFIK